MVSKHSSVTAMGSHTMLLDTWHVGSETTVQTSVGRLAWEETVHCIFGALPAQLAQFIDTLHWCTSFILVPVEISGTIVIQVYFTNTICIFCLSIHIYMCMWILYRIHVYNLYNYLLVLLII